MCACIVWKGALTPDGYPRRVYRGNYNTRWHRVVYAEHNGLSLEDIRGKVVMHTCDEPRCVNPQHLVLGTHSMNMLDRDRKGRHGMTKITKEQAEFIRNCGGTNVSVAKKFGIDARTVSSIRCGHHWNWI